MYYVLCGEEILYTVISFRFSISFGLSRTGFTFAISCLAVAMEN